MKRFAILLAILALVAGAMLYPVTYRLQAECRIQPAMHRTIAVPFDATLQRSHVRPGDAVSKGQLLAELDGREIRIQLAEAIAARNIAMKRRDNAMVVEDAREVQMAQLEAERIKLQVNRLQSQLDQLQILSPIDGMVLTGDLTRSEGVPVRTGQKLFEIVSLDKMMVGIAVPENQAQYVPAGARVRMRLESNPRKLWEATIERIRPHPEIADGRNVFLAESTLGNAEGQLMPGMKGSVRIMTGQKKPIGWILLH